MRVGGRRPRRGAEHQEPRHQAGAGGARAARPTTASRSPARRSRTTSATCGRSWTSSTPASWARRQRVPARRSSCRSRRYRDRRGGRAAAAPHRARSSCAGSRPTAAIIADLPDKLEMKVFCTLTARAGRALRGGGRGGREAQLDDAEGIERRGVVLAALTKLKQVCNHPAQFLGDGSALAGPLGQAGAPDRDAGGGDRARATARSSSPSSPRWASCCSGTCRTSSAARCSSCTAACRKTRRDAMVERFQSDDATRRPSSCSRSRRAAPAST